MPKLKEALTIQNISKRAIFCISGSVFPQSERYVPSETSPRIVKISRMFNYKKILITNTYLQRMFGQVGPNFS